MKPLHIAILTMLATVVVAPAQATTRQYEPRSKEVSYADLDLTQHAGVEKLYFRIRTAARSVCRVDGVLAIVPPPRTRACAAEATARAVADVNTPSLTRYHAERTGTVGVDQEGRTAYRANVPGTMIVAVR